MSKMTGLKAMVQPEITCERNIRMIPKLAIVAIAVTIPVIGNAQDAAAIVRKSVEQYSKNEQTLRNYTYKSLSVEKDLDGKGNVKATHSQLDEILYIGGRRFTHALAKDGKPMSAAEEKHGQQVLEAATKEASRLSPEERQAREEESIRKRSAREPLRHVPEAYSLVVVGEPVVNGRAQWQIRATPRRDYKGQYASVFRNIEGTIWVDKQDFAWVRFEADTTETISFGFFLARIARGTRISIARSRLNDEVWAPLSMSFKGSARVAVVKSVAAEEEVNYSDYRRFRTDSKMVDPQ